MSKDIKDLEQTLKILRGGTPRTTKLGKSARSTKFDANQTKSLPRTVLEKLLKHHPLEMTLYYSKTKKNE
jgi:hypothetical protein